MEQRDSATETDGYDTAINVIGGLRDCIVIFKAIDAHFSESDSLKELIEQRNEFSLRTEKSRARVQREIQKAFVHFKSEEHESLVQGIFSRQVPLQDRLLVIFWQFALNNRLFREISSTVFAKTYYSGRTSISKDDIVAYLKDSLSQKESLATAWSENTIKTLATKYLNLMSKLGFVSTGRSKTFNHIRPSSESQVLFLYFAKLFSPSNRNIRANEFLPLSFVPSDDVQDRLKKLSLKGFFNMNFNGVALNIDLTHSYQGICDDLYS